MATPNVGILTNAGKNLIDQVNAGKTKITFSKIVFSSMDNSQLSDMQVKALTAIAPQEVVVSSPETTLDTNSGETRIRATGTNEKLADGVYVKTYGVFAKDDTGSEILYGVTVSPNPNYFPAYDGVTPQAVTYSYKTVIQETSNITMTNSNDVYASQEDLTEALQPYAKTVDVNQQLDKKVNIADMRKPASDVAGIEEVSAKQDKIGYTPADDSKVVHTTDASNWQKQAMSLPSTLYMGTNPAGTNFATYVNANFNNAGVYYIRDNNANVEGADHALDVTLLVEPGGAWKYAFGVSWGNGMYYRSVTPNGDSGWKLLANDSAVVHNSGNEEIAGQKTFDTAPIDKTTGNTYITKSDVTTAISAATANKVNITDTSNWQKTKVTNDNGSPLINLTNSNQDLSATLVSLGLGLYTVYANGSVQNNPLKGISSVKGVIDIQGTAYGEGFLIGSTNQGISMYHVWLDGSKANYTQIANDSTVVHSTDMRKPASDVAGIEEVNAKQDKIGYTPADDSKVVHSTDMRKPASDVAGIEEVNAKQDKIGYTPADDSTVLHNNALNQILTDNSGIIIGNDKDFGFIKRQGYKGGLAIGSGNSFHFLATNDVTLSNNSSYHDVWNILPNGQVSILDGAYFMPADDSKVAHLSGANNFDTVPTVNNNPLLLASSLPSDLARTSQQTNFTAGLQSGGVDVATAADLKSVEASAWRELGNNYVTLSGSDNPYATIGTWVLYRLDTINKRLYFMFTMGSNVANGATAKISFSSVVNNISDPKLPSFVNYFLQNGNLLSITVSGNSLSFTISNSFYACSMYSQYGNTNNLQYDMCFVNYDKLV